MGILPSYLDQSGRRQRTSDATRVALLAAMGVDASTEAAARRAIEAMNQAAGQNWLSPVHVAQAGTRRTWSTRVRPPDDWPETIDWHAELREEDGPVHCADGRARRRKRAADFGIALPRRLPPGYHTLRVHLSAGRHALDGEQMLIVAPGSCPDPVERFGGRRFFGLCANLYTIRSGRDWGIGDLADLRDLVHWSSQIGAAFVGLSPLHALHNRAGQISPYYPVSRLYHNVVYLDVATVPELGQSAEARRRLQDGGFRSRLEQLRGAEHVDYEGVMDLKMPLLELLYETFVARHAEGRTARGRAYTRYLRDQGEPLQDFATFLALESHFSRRRAEPSDWRAWRPTYRHPRSAAVRAFREKHARQIGFHCYLQFELDRQLGLAADRARAAGLPIGLYQDLAIGSAPDGSDTWAFPGLFVEAASLGAPPDNFHRAGQNWGLPPIDPRRLAADRYRYWILVLRAALRHGGAIRLDHVMGLFRQFWIPRGSRPSDGAYVRQPADHLLGILALETKRHGAVVVGEDLGTVPRGLRRSLARWGMLSSRVLYFERRKRGTYRASRAYPARALATVNTHDLPTLAGFWEGRDVALRRETGQLAADEERAAAERERCRDRRALLRRLVAEGVLQGATESPSRTELSRSVHAFLSRTPSVLVGVSLDDLVGETEPVNLPGVGPDRYPSWSRRLRTPLETLRTDPAVAEALIGTRERRT